MMPDRVPFRAAVVASVFACLFAPRALVAQDVRAVSVSSPEVAVEGGRMTITATLAAAATRAPPAFRWAAYLTADGAIDGAVLLGRFGPVALAAGESRASTEEVAIPAGTRGFFTLAVVADSTQVIAEPNELDNVARAPNAIRIRARMPDVVVVSASAREAEARAGAAVRVGFTAENAGELPATVSLGAYASRDANASPSDVRLGSARVTLAAGQRLDGALDGVLPGDMPVGAWTIAVIADAEAEVSEISEENDVAVAARPLVVFADGLSIVTTSLPEGTASIDYHALVAASGGDGAYAFRVASGALPDGLVLDVTSGVVSGTPIASGTFTATVEVSSRGVTATAGYEILIHGTGAPLAIVSERVADGAIGLPYEERLIASGGEPPYAWSVLGDGLPPGLELSKDGVLAGEPSALGGFSFSVVVRDRLGAEDTLALELSVSPAVTLVILDADPPPLTVGVPVDHALAVAGGVPPYRWEALSTPPPGLSITPEGHVVGTPAGVGRFPILVRASDATRTGAQDSRLVQVVIRDDGALTIDNQRLDVAPLRAHYEATLRASGGTPPYAWSIVRGDQPPDGFFLVASEDDTATLRGTPVRPMVHGFGVEVRDAVGRRAAKTFLLEVPKAKDRLEAGCACLSPPARDVRGLVSLGLVGLFGLVGRALGWRPRARRTRRPPRGAAPHSPSTLR